MAFAGEAPSQKLPTVADPKLQSYSDRLEAIRQRYGAGYLAARQNDINNYQRALQLYRQDQARKAQNDLAKAKIAQSAAQFAIKNDREERKMKQDAAYKERELGIRQSNLRSLEQYRTAKANGSGADKSIDIIGRNGKRFTLSGKDKDGVIAYMYKRMLEYAEDHPKENKSISDISWQFGEGGDQKTKQAAIVMSNIQNFPELYDEFDQIIGSGGSSTSTNKKSIGWDNNSSSKNVGW